MAVENNVQVSKVESFGYDDLYLFNQECYPSRSNIKERFQFQVLANPEDTLPPSFLVAFDEKRMVGQFGLSPRSYSWRGKQVRGFCGFDLFVSEKWRGKGVGSSLVNTAIKNFSPLFPIGVSEAAKSKYLGFQQIGEAHTFVYIRKLTTFFKGLNYFLRRGKRGVRFKGSSFSDSSLFPDRLSQGNFRKMKELPEWKDYGLGDNFLQFSRELDFLKWRFFTKPGYHFYLSESESAYFVVREVDWKGFKVLLLVDYKVQLNDREMFKAILKNTKILAKKSSCEAIITMSSHVFFDCILSRSLFFKAGNPSLVLTNAQLGLSLEEIKQKAEQRKLVVMTMADADFEFAYW